jgi:hypothetical protein
MTRRQPFATMKRILLSAIGALLCTSIAQAQTAAQPASVQPSARAGFAGEWTLAFSSQSRTGEPNLKPSPWLTFTATVVQVDSTLGGAMRSDGPTGQFGCRLRGDECTAGRMRLSWDDQEWQVFQFTLDPGSTTRGSGRAEIRFPDGSVHTYTFVLSRP